MVIAEKRRCNSSSIRRNCRLRSSWNEVRPKPIRTATRMSPYQICRRHLMELKIFMSLNAIAVATPRGDEISAQLFADVGDMNVQQIGHRAFILIKEMLVKLRPRDDFAAVDG